MCVTAFSFALRLHLAKYPLLDLGVVKAQRATKPSIIFDMQGNEIARFAASTRLYAPLTRMPQHLINAFIATEDWNFFKHHGLSFKGIIRSILVNLYYGRKMQGASTITQQLVKLHFFDGQKTFIRKFKEQLYALLVECQYTKQQILECYCNSVYFGSGLYGVQAAAKAFWNKDVSQLSLSESALLAAIVCSPGNYSPIAYPLSARRRRNVVLKKMEKLKFISSLECYDAQQAPLQVNPVQMSKQELGTLGAAMREHIRRWIETNLSKEQVVRGGLTIQTTIDSNLQAHARKVFTQHLKKNRLAYGGDLDGALISIEGATGAIRAIITGYDQSGEDHFNRACNARRQQGSVFKPLVYAAALNHGMSFADTAVDEPLEIAIDGKIWKPRNYSRSFDGTMTLARALVHSNNIITIKILLTLGVEPIINLARQCHLTGPIPPYPSLALGCVDSTLIEVAGMFNIFAQQGMYVEPYCVAWVKDEWGNRVYQNHSHAERVLATTIANKVGNVLTIASERKRSLFKHWIDCQAMSKTGTTNDSRTCWFAGSTPERTTVVYIGCDDNRPLGYNVFPVHTAFPLWLDFHMGVPTRSKRFTYDPLLVPCAIDGRTGQQLSIADQVSNQTSQQINHSYQILM